MNFQGLANDSHKLRAYQSIVHGHRRKHFFVKRWRLKIFLLIHRTVNKFKAKADLLIGFGRVQDNPSKNYLSKGNQVQTKQHQFYDHEAQSVVLNTDRKKGILGPLLTKPKVLTIHNSQDAFNLHEVLSDEFDVIWEKNPLKAFDVVLSELPDLVISEVRLPEINGFDLCARIKNDLQVFHIPVVLLTSKESIKSHILGYQKGADDCMYKPIVGELLIERIKNLIRQRQQIRKHYIGSKELFEGDLPSGIASNDFMEEVLNLIKTNYNDPGFNVNTIIREFGMSRSVFYKKLKAISTHSINDLIRNFRLNQAKEHLKSGELSISEIAYRTGFNNPTYFSTVFKEHFKVSPKEYAFSERCKS